MKFQSRQRARRRKSLFVFIHRGPRLELLGSLRLPFFGWSIFFYVKGFEEQQHSGWKRFKQRASDHHFSIRIDKQCIAYVSPRHPPPPRIVNMCGGADVVLLARGDYANIHRCKWDLNEVQTRNTAAAHSYVLIFFFFISPQLGRKLWFIHSEFSAIAGAVKASRDICWGSAKFPLQ